MRAQATKEFCTQTDSRYRGVIELQSVPSVDLQVFIATQDKNWIYGRKNLTIAPRFQTINDRLHYFYIEGLQFGKGLRNGIEML
jgi:hypothetical protein